MNPFREALRMMAEGKSAEEAAEHILGHTMPRRRSILDQMLDSLNGGMPRPGKGNHHSQPRGEDALDRFINEPGCGKPDCWHCNLGNFIKAKLDGNDSIEQTRLLRHLPEFFASSDKSAEFLMKVTPLFDLAIEFAESNGFKNQAELFRIYKTAADSITRLCEQWEGDDQNSMTWVDPNPIEVEEEEQEQAAPPAGETEPAPAAAGPSPKRSRRKSDDDYAGNDHRG